jgi:citrate lyase subunit beta/citryl-CoA lyase
MRCDMPLGRLLRTALFVPGNRPDRVDKAVHSGADAVVIDLEDAVALAEKAETRPRVREKVVEHAGRDIVVRVNGLNTPFFEEDLETVITSDRAAIMVPKVEEVDDIHEIHRRLLEVENEKDLPRGSVSIVPLIESALGVQNVFQIVSGDTDPPRIATVAFGAADYTRDLGIEMTRHGEELTYPRSRIAIACRAAGVNPPLDTPFMIDLKDMEGLRADAKRAKDLGFQGKLCIHPNQIEPCHAVFSPTEEEVSFAKRVVQAFEEAETRGIAAIQLGGRFIDYPVVERSRRILELTAAIESK